MCQNIGFNSECFFYCVTMWWVSRKETCVCLSLLPSKHCFIASVRESCNCPSWLGLLCCASHFDWCCNWIEIVFDSLWGKGFWIFVVSVHFCILVAFSSYALGALSVLLCSDHSVELNRKLQVWWHVYRTDKKKFRLWEQKQCKAAKQAESKEEHSAKPGFLQIPPQYLSA